MIRGFLICIFLGTMIIFSSVSYAGFRVCNRTKNLIGVAIGYPLSNGNWTTQGWWHIPKNSCETIIEGALSSRYYYLHVEGISHGERWLGNVQMCVGEDEFTIVDIKDCYARGYLRASFIEYDTGQHESWTVQLTESSLE